ncbi:MAG TPA: hypothetical protein VLX92_18345 [Kofleriaceae bacterium]|nr:hypothetical protein [Kofleriaceae bacterium]
MRHTTAYALAGLFLAACSTTSIDVGSLQEVTTLKAIPNRDLDLLFVIDNSPSMADNQLALAEAFPELLEPLEQLDDGLPNLHIGVVTSDMGTTGGNDPDDPAPPIDQGAPGGCVGQGDDGALQVNGAPVTGNFISDVANPDGSRTRNYSGALSDTFAQMARVGENGCGFEQHLRSMLRALQDNPHNTGFVRPGANLAVVIVADEDDCSVLDPGFFTQATSILGPVQSFRCFKFGVECSPDDPDSQGPKLGCVPRAASPWIEDVQPVANALLALKPDPRMVMVSGIVGDPGTVAVGPAPDGSMLEPSCQYDQIGGDPESADPAVRLAAFLDLFPDREKRTSICNPDLSGALSDIGESAKRLVGDPCIDTAGLADSSSAPGIQPACEVTDVRDSAPDAPRLLPACAGHTTGDCYALVADPAACPASDDHLRVEVRRATPPADDTWTHVRCQLANP